METHRDDFDLTAELKALRPSPSAAFADELDARVVAGFAKDERSRKDPFSAIARAIREASPRRLALPAGATVLAALVIATAVVAVEQGRDSGSPTGQIVKADKSADERGAAHSGGELFSTPQAAPRLSGDMEQELSDVGRGTSGAGYQLEGGSLTSASRRRIERDAELVLGSEPGEIHRNAEEVFTTVHAANGIVLRSSIHDQSAGADVRGASRASANFELLIPAARLGDAMASLSRIADIRSRHESTHDITASTVSIGDLLKDSEATIEGMLAQLASAESYGERSILERQLRHERRHAAALRAQLDRLRQRARFAHVTLRIESGPTANDSGSGDWGIDDAFNDAGRVLTIAAGVALIGLAVLAPVALIALLVWLAYRAWVRQRRERALS